MANMKYEKKRAVEKAQNDRKDGKYRGIGNAWDDWGMTTDQRRERDATYDKEFFRDNGNR